jgi:hypothetical protein
VREVLVASRSSRVVGEIIFHFIFTHGETYYKKEDREEIKVRFKGGAYICAQEKGCEKDGKESREESEENRKEGRQESSEEGG